ncbi:DUF305 domain-containing protein [Streptomyces atroolivaceus]|uniref:DUF305 domain-containing protein n=1 Tax=Streptomyces atroolivaceus TaxID=66869 RepID=UPI00363EA355
MAARRTAALLLLLTVLTSCAEGGPRATEAAPTPSRTPTAPVTDLTDSAWLQLMIPMNEQAVTLLELAAEKATGPRLRSWAKGLRDAQAVELTTLRKLRDRMGLPDTDVHKGHDMPGMVTAEDLEDARTAEGAAFDRLVVTRILDHLRQSERVSRSQTAAGSRADAKARARALVTARGEQLAVLTALYPGKAADVPEPFA